MTLQPPPEHRAYPYRKGTPHRVSPGVLIAGQLVRPLLTFHGKRDGYDDIGPVREADMPAALVTLGPSADDGSLASLTDPVPRRENRKKKVLIPRRDLGDSCHDAASRPHEIWVSRKDGLDAVEHIVNRADHGRV